MSLLARIRSDSIEARKASIGKPADAPESVRSTLLVTLYGEAAKIGKDAGNRDTTDDEVSGVIRKFVKNIDETLKLNIAEPVRLRVQSEREVLSAYLPQELDVDTLRAEIAKIAEERGAPLTVRDTGFVRGVLNEKFPGQINGKALSDLLKETA